MVMIPPVVVVIDGGGDGVVILSDNDRLFVTGTIGQRPLVLGA